MSPPFLLRYHDPEDSLQIPLPIACLAVALTSALSAQTHTAWRDYSGSPDAAQYSALKQIDSLNVSHLEVAWTYPVGDDRHYFFNPIVIEGTMYVLAKNNSIVALDATTGGELWTHTPSPEVRTITNRGINYWESRDRTDRRLLFCAEQSLRAIDARTGKPIRSFGVYGAVDLKEGLDRDPRALTSVQSTTPGRVFEDKLIIGSATNQGYGSAPGDIRAFDVRSGKLVWTFHTVPRPGEFGYDTWPKDAWRTVGGANVWSEFAPWKADLAGRGTTSAGFRRSGRKSVRDTAISGETAAVLPPAVHCGRSKPLPERRRPRPFPRYDP